MKHDIIAIIIVASVLTPALSTSAAQVNQVREKQWHLNGLDVASAQGISTGEDVTIAVADTGIAPHPDLIRNLLPGVSLASTKSRDGRYDPDGHGTGMAGIIAAHGQGATQGLLGIAPAAKILPIQYVSPGEEGNAILLSKGIKWAITHGAEIINISASGGPSSHLQEAIEMARRADIIIIAAAGNHPQDYGVGFPAAYPGVIAVGGSDRDGNRAKVSVTGPELDILAPAVDIYSTSYNGKYRKGTGTSDAAAIVAGAAALVRSKFPNLPAEEVVHRLTATAVDKGKPGRDDEYGYGVLDLVAALTADVPPLGFESATAPEPGKTSPTTTAAAAPGNGAGGGRLPLGIGAAVVAAVAAVFFRRRRRRRAPGVGRPGP